MATPHSAMAHPGSVFAIWAKVSPDFWYQNECSMATARLKSPCTAGLQEVANWTVPSLSGAVLACSCCAATSELSASHGSSIHDTPQCLIALLTFVVMF